MSERFIRKIGYKCTMVEKLPFGEVTMRFWEPRNWVGRLYNWFIGKYGLVTDGEA